MVYKGVAVWNLTWADLANVTAVTIKNLYQYIAWLIWYNIFVSISFHT